MVVLCFHPYHSCNHEDMWDVAICIHHVSMTTLLSTVTWFYTPVAEFVIFDIGPSVFQRLFHEFRALIKLMIVILTQHALCF